jgi:two-component system response regulator AtoC
VLDDDEGFRWALAENLRDDGHQVIDYEGPSCVPSLADLDVDVVITDLHMAPGDLDGLAVADAVHAARPALPVVIATAYSTTHVAAQVRARGHVHLVSKPVDYAELLRLVADLAAPGS